MDVLREREVKDNIERQLIEEQKLRGKYMNQRIPCVVLQFFVYLYNSLYIFTILCIS